MRGTIMRRTVVALLLISSAALCASVEDLVKQADAVIIGVGDQPVKSGHLVAVRLVAERVLKGSVVPGAVLNLEWDSDTDAVLWRTPPALHGVWFLRATPSGWKIILAKPSQIKVLQNLFYATSAAGLPSALAYSESDSIPDKLILEIGGAPENAPSDILQAASGSSSPGTMRLFRYLAQSKSMDVKLAGLAGLLERGDAAAIQELETGSQGLRSSRGFRRVTSAVGFAFRSTAPESIKALGRMATAKEQPPELRVAAAQALSAIHTRETLPYLAALLDEPDPPLLSYAVVGLSFFANGVGTQTVTAGLDHLNKRQPSVYRTKETEQYLGFDAARQQEFVEFWRRWWSRNQMDLVQQP
jgi:hypothetical protein